MPEGRLSTKFIIKCLLNPIAFLVLAIPMANVAQQTRPPKPDPQKTTAARPSTPLKTEQSPPERTQNPQEEARSPRARAADDQHFDMAETPPVITHHEIPVNGRVLRLHSNGRPPGLPARHHLLRGRNATQLRYTRQDDGTLIRVGLFLHKHIAIWKHMTQIRWFRAPRLSDSPRRQFR
jgi:hypothetical protein